MKRGYFIFDDIRSSDYGVYISAGMTFNDAEDDFEAVEIPGRSGDLLISKKRFRNKAGEYPAFIFASSAEEFSQKMSRFRSAIGSKSGYFKLYDSYNPDTYILAAYLGGITVETAAGNKAGEFAIPFTCKPQRYLISGDGEIEYTSNGNIFNPTLYSSKPLLVITGYGTLGIGDYSVTIIGDSSTVTYIDCDVMEAYSINNGTKTSRNGYISTGAYFPELKPRESGVQLANTISKVVITPRWWKK